MAKEPRIDIIGLNSEDYTGNIYKTWNNEYIADYNNVNSSNVFGADIFASRKGLIR